MRTNKLVGCGVVALMALAGGSACGHSLRVELLQDEGWWGGATKLGTKAPYGLKAKALSFDISRFNYENQVAPLMQFSAAPWRLLKGEHLEAVRAAAWLRMKWTPYIVETAKDCAKSGEPMLRAMEYEFPGLGAASVTDQFMLGSRLLVAPQTEKGAMMRMVFVPTGLWTADDGMTVTGPATVEVSTPLSRLPHFVRNER